MNGDVTDKSVYRIFAETHFRMFCMPIKKQMLKAVGFSFCCAVKI
jgi:hypothetical protein